GSLRGGHGGGGADRAAGGAGAGGQGASLKPVFVSVRSVVACGLAGLFSQGENSRINREGVSSPPETPLATHRRCAALPCSAFGCPGALTLRLRTRPFGRSLL